MGKGAVVRQGWLGGHCTSPGENSIPLIPKAGSQEGNGLQTPG